MTEKTCHLVGAGDFFGLYEEIRADDIVIAVDGGYKVLTDMGIMPHFVVGDFDSLGTVPAGENVTVLPSEKDVTDMFTAINKGIENGFFDFAVYGGTGGRLDHTIANIQLLKYFSEKGVKIRLYGDGFTVTAVSDGKITLNGKKGSYISVFSLSEECSVSLIGLKYELQSHTLDNAFPLGVSNEFTDRPAEISVEGGTLAVYYTIGKD